MVGIDLEVLPSSSALVERATEFFVQQIAARPSRLDPFLIALSGGRISQEFFETLALKLHASSAALETLHFFWADERCVPPQDPECNFAMAKSKLFDPLGISQTQIHRIEGELPPDQAVANAVADLCRIAPKTHLGQPVIDLLILGMGEDEHTASLFPNESKAAQESPAIYRHVVAPKPPPNRITLGYPALASARTVLILISGSTKREPLRHALNPTSQSPMAKMLQSRQPTQSTRVLTDFPL